MKKHFVLSALCTLLLTGYTFADSNATSSGTGTVINMETFTFPSLGAPNGPYEHWGPVGTAGNSITTATFVGGFTANQVTISGIYTENPANTATISAEADIRLTDPGAASFHNWQHGFAAGPGPTPFTTTGSITGDYPGGIDPAGVWGVEFYDSFDDGPGFDATSSSVTMTFEEFDPIVFNDSNGVFSLPSLGFGDTATSVGEIAFGGANAVYDLYSVTLNQDSIFDFNVTGVSTGVIGSGLDSRIGIFDSAGVLLAEADGTGSTGTENLNLALDAGTYSLFVGGWNMGLADGPTITNGFTNITGDYDLSVSVQIPEPTSIAIFAMIGLGIVARRRRA